ncbi:MAG: hypothetical protein ACI4EL_03520 [Candidatus Fimimorpha sp.]
MFDFGELLADREPGSNAVNLRIIMLSATNRAASDTHGSDPIPIRVIRVELDSGVTEYLATNVMDPDITPEMFKELSFLRWKIESKYNELKKRLEIEEFSGATPVSVEQEFYIKLFTQSFLQVKRMFKAGAFCILADMAPSIFRLPLRP